MLPEHQELQREGKQKESGRGVAGRAQGLVKGSTIRKLSRRAPPPLYPHTASVRTGKASAKNLGHSGPKAPAGLASAGGQIQTLLPTSPVTPVQGGLGEEAGVTPSSGRLLEMGSQPGGDGTRL